MTRPGRLVLAVYVATLGVSYAVRIARDVPRPLPGNGGVVELAAIDSGAIDRSRVVRVAYRDLAPPAPADIPVLILHGSPGDGGQLMRFATALADTHRVIVPDLPGFGASTWSIPDYSIRAHAAYAAGLLDRLGVTRAHVIGFSMGGGVALHFVEMAPDRAASLVLLSAIGAQEYELLGSYELNHALHGLQLAGLWLLREGLPHFGALDRADLGVSYARNFYDTDQRPLRGIMQRLTLPALIVHGVGDALVPIEAAYEHARLIPQSEVRTIESDHFIPFRQPGQVAGVVRDFHGRVESGRGVTRGRASPERLQAAAEERPIRLPPARGVTAAVLALLLALGTLVSEDLACLAAGMLVAYGRVSFTLAVASTGVGIVIGDVLLFMTGRSLSRSRLAAAIRRRALRPDLEARTARWLRERGGWAVFASRFLPGTRLPTYVGAGWLGMPLRTFLVYFMLAAAIWTPLLVGFGVVPTRWLMGAGLGGGSGAAASLAMLVVLAVAVRVIQSAVIHRDRRWVVSWWRRTTRWEFWPPWLFYPPVFAYIAWQMLRHRSATLFTVANPGIIGGGFVGESKSAILDSVRAVSDAVAPYVVLDANDPPDARRAAARRFASAHRLPVVLKPDHGQRGSGVVIIRSLEQLDALVGALQGATILQAYVAGVEFGIFYVRRPSEPNGRLISVTDKQLPVLVGDGRRSLERLILDDDRAVAMAGFYLRANDERRAWVPAAGERVQLSELGTHCRGAIFLDGRDALTPALERAVDAIASRIDGFYFGRFDVRAESREAFAAGRFTILELNGVTSEATHIYDPANSIWTAYRVLFEQWRLAFEIGAENRRRGAAPTSMAALFRLTMAYRQTARGHLGQ
jgi:pimeloyl-ACP methyl ester carboxylesterase/membrane protein DedA with SNARE-associated domain